MVSLAARAIGAYSRLVLKRQPRSPEQLVTHLRKRLDNSPLPVLLLPIPVVEPTFRTLLIAAIGRPVLPAPGFRAASRAAIQTGAHFILCAGP